MESFAVLAAGTAVERVAVQMVAALGAASAAVAFAAEAVRGFLRGLIELLRCLLIQTGEEPGKLHKITVVLNSVGFRLVSRLDSLIP